MIVIDRILNTPLITYRIIDNQIIRTSPYLVRMRENAHQNNSEYAQFFRSDYDLFSDWFYQPIPCDYIFTRDQHQGFSVEIFSETEIYMYWDRIMMIN